MDKAVRVRFAPSPTGYLHVGGARTALFNYLFARHNKGKFILRIEDTDQKRFQQDALEEIYASLEWLDLTWDEGPKCGGGKGPYIQSERTDLYKKAAEELIKKGSAYRCFCTQDRLRALREKQKEARMQAGSGYDRFCRELSSRQLEQNLDENIPFVVRLKIPDGKIITFNDLIRGKINYESELLDDIVLLKSDGFPTYHLANVVDDYAMGITHVMRGEEWITSTPRHIILYKALGYQLPEFAHLPIILSEEGGKLSKRKGAASVMDYQAAGYLPEALINFLSLLGWAPGNDLELMNREEIIEKFTLDRITAKASVFDNRKLEWMNGCYMRERSLESIFSLVKGQWKQSGFTAEAGQDETYLKRVVELLKDRSKRVNEIVESAGYFFHDPPEYEEKAAKKRFKGRAREILRDLTGLMEILADFSAENLEDLFRRYAEKNELSGGKLIHPARVAVSGSGTGPGIFELLETLGRKTVIRRMQKALKWIAENIKDTE